MQINANSKFKHFGMGESCIYNLLNSELRLISYEINHFNMSFMQINANSKLNIFNMEVSGILWN